MMTRVDERSPETSMTEIVIGPWAAGWPGGSMAIHVSGSASATAGTRARLIEPPLGKHPVGTRTPERCQGAGEPSLFEEARRGVLCPPAKRTTVVSHAASVRHAALRENVQSLEHSESAATVTLTSRWPSRTRADTSGHGDDPTL